MILEKIPYLRVLISLSVVGEGVRWFGDLDPPPAGDPPCPSFVFTFMAALIMLVAHIILFSIFVFDDEFSDFTGGGKCPPVDGRLDLVFFVSAVFAHVLYGDWDLDKSHWNAFLTLSACGAAVLDSKICWYETRVQAIPAMAKWGFGWVRHLVTIFLILFAPALCFTDVFTKHLVASLTSPPGQRWRHFCDKSIVDVLVPFLLQVGEISGAFIARLQAAIKKG
ncbi:hypothetical protein EsDP_00001535 [Epichloe bromicola]|uniref:Uncharacterized protein n=1 Tax=Epichloe bromicola TaxID=79588 RepID=A0ABQ0CI47_9HYPO